MDLLTAIRERRSCRNFVPEPVTDEALGIILDAAMWAPSPANNQPWEFVVVLNQETKDKIFDEASERKKMLFERSGWKWMNKYSVDFIKSAPAIIAVVGDPKKSGADMFLDESRGMAYQQACAAAIQNMLLAAHSLGYAGLWYTLYEKNTVRSILDIPAEKDPLALIFLGKPGAEPMRTPRKDRSEMVKWVR
jgi:5,6-dimethylbenzimidazole synthase